MNNKQLFRPSEKQAKSLLSMLDGDSIQVFQGGSANAGKSYTASFFSIFSSFNLPGVRVAICRKFMTSSAISVQKTLVEILKKWGYDYGFNTGTNVLSFPNGSNMTLISLEPKTADNNFTQIQGSEFSIAMVEEVNEVKQKYFNRFIPRVRYGLDKYDIVPKILLTCNPPDGDSWVITEWFFDENNNPVTLKEGQARYVYTQSDNPTQSKRLKKSMDLADEVTKEKFADGIFRRTGFKDPLSYFNEFSQTKNVEHGLKNRILKECPGYPLHISFDFNSLPYISILITIIKNDGVYIIEEIKATPPNNQTEKATKLLLEKWGEYIEENGCILYGDRSGNSKNTIGVTDFQIIKKTIGLHNIKEDKTLSYNGSLKDRRKYLNHLFTTTGEYNNHPSILIDANCVELINDCLLGRADANGLPDKKAHKVNGVETRFHLSDAMWYLIYGQYPHKMKEYLNELRGNKGGGTGIVTTDKYLNYGGWNY